MLQSTKDLDSSEDIGAVKTRTSEEAYRWNITWLCFYTIALQWSHLRRGVFLNFNWTPANMKNWPICLWITFIFFIGLIVFNLSYLAYRYYYVGCLWVYILYHVLVYLVFFIINQYLGKGYEVHIHHYFIGLFFTDIYAY